MFPAPKGAALAAPEEANSFEVKRSINISRLDGAPIESPRGPNPTCLSRYRSAKLSLNPQSHPGFSSADETEGMSVAELDL
jgi:hypothetical protein